MFDKAEQRAMELENNYCLLNTWKERGDDLLYSMIPKPVADRLRNGSDPLSTCEVGQTCFQVILKKLLKDIKLITIVSLRKTSLIN